MLKPIQIKSEVLGTGDGSRREFSLRYPPHPGTVSVRMGESYQWTELVGTWTDNADFRRDTLKASYPEADFVAISTGAVVFATPPAAGMLILADYTVAVPDSEEYQARILDRHRQMRAVLPGIRWQYSRRINEATEINIYIPRAVVDEHIPAGHSLRGYFSTNKAQCAEIAALVQICKGNELKISGKINRRTLGEIVTIQAYTEEILLEGNLTPAQYGKVWDGWDLADIARDLLDGWQSIRVKDASQWQGYMVGSSNIDLTTDPGHVMLAKRSNGRYYESGYITLAFGSGEIVNFKRWDRIRWSADSEDPVKTTIQYSTDGANWSTEFDGGLPEEIGLVPNFTTEDTVYVRINLYTSDTEAEDPDGNPVGVTPTVFAVELIARTEGDLVAGNIPDVAGVTVKGIEADHASAFQVLLAACEQNGWEFQVVNGALSVAENLGTDRTNDFVLRGGTNMEITSLGDEDEELVNVLTAYGPGQGINRLEVVLRDEASVAQYGPYPEAIEFDADDLVELQAKAQAYLDAHSEPRTQFDVFVAFDHHREPEYGLGDNVRVVDPDTGIITKSRIMAETREYGDDGLSVHLELGKAGLSLQSVLEHEPGAKPADPMQPTGVYARSIIAGLAVGCAAPRGDWAYTECHISPVAEFVPTSGTIRTRGRQTRFEVTGLETGRRYYARIVHVDSKGRRSVSSVEVSAIAGKLPEGALDVRPVSAPQWGPCQFITDVDLSWSLVHGAMAYEIRTDNDNWGQEAGMIYRGNALGYRFLPKQRNYTFHIKAINAAGVYSESVSSISLSLDPPMAPDQPEVIEFFRLLKVKVVPLNNAAVLGYYVYLTKTGESEPVVETLRAGESLSYPAEPGTTFSIQVAAFDILGSGAKSEPLVATTTFLGEPDIPEGIVSETKLSQALQEKINTAADTSWLPRVEAVEGQYTVKMQGMGADGNPIATGFGLAVDDQNITEFGVLADRFKIYGTTEGGTAQAVFAVDTQTNKLYLLGDLIADGSITSRMVGAQQIITEKGNIAEAVIDTAHIDSIEASKITVGGKPHGMAIAMPQGAQLFHFDGTLMSTQGLEPTTATASIADGGGKFGSAVAVAGQLKYPVTGGTVVVQRDETTWSDYSSMTWTQLNAM